MSTPEDVVLRYIMQNQGRLLPPDAQRASEVQAYVEANRARFSSLEQDEPGFIEKYGGGLLELLRTVAAPSTMTSEDVARLGVTGANIAESAIVKPFIESLPGALGDISQIATMVPGFPLRREAGAIGEAADRVSDFGKRIREGIITEVEAGAMQAGLSAQEVGAAEGLGAFIGFTMPLAASYKAAGILFNMPRVSALRWPMVAHLPQDFTAGAIFGGLMEPAEGVEQRLQHAASESALFGVGRLVFNGLFIPWTGLRARRFRRFRESERLDDLINRVKNGETVVVTPEESKFLPLVMTEEEYMASSIKAQMLVEANQSRAALVQGLVDSADAGSSSGIIRDLRLSYQEVQGSISELKGTFPNLKFDIIKNKKTGNYDVVFGTQGLSNIQRAEMARTGRFPGLLVEKNGKRYEYVGPAAFAKGDKRPRINVIANPGTEKAKPTAIFDENVTDLFTARERIQTSQVINKLYDDFRKTVEKEIDLFTAPGILTEADIIQMVEQGTLQLDDNARRALSLSGAIVHPEELGLAAAGEDAISGVIFAQGRRRGRLQRIGTIREEGGWGFVEYGEFPSDSPKRMIEIGPDFQTAIQRMEKSGWIPEETIFTTQRAQDFITAFAQDGMRAGGTMSQWFPYFSFDDVANQWARERGLPIDAPDWPATRAYFANRARRDWWAKVPEEDRIVFENVQKEWLRLSEKMEIPLKAQAHNKGFNLYPIEDGHYVLRDIRTGATITLQSEGAVRETLSRVSRPGKDMVETLLPFEGVGVGSMTGGFEHPGANLFFGDLARDATHMTDIDLPFLYQFRNVRDLFMYVEEQTKFPLFTQVFDQVDTGISRMKASLEPINRRIEDIWKKVPEKGKAGRIQLAEWWMEIEGIDMTMAQAISYLDQQGATAAQKVAYRRSRELFDLWYQQAGLGEGRYIHHYYSRVRPWVEAHRGRAPNLTQIFDDIGGIPPEYQFWAEMSRTGELALVEKDPALVMYRYARALHFKQHVRDPYNRARKLVIEKSTPRIRDLPADIKAEVLANNPNAVPDDPILPEPLRDVIKEYLNIIRGTPDASVKNLRKFTRRFFNSLGMEADDRTIENLIDLHLSNMYGAAMALRPKLTARNATQTIWTLYTRLGGRFGSESLERAITMAGYDEVIASGAIRSAAAGVSQGDAIWEVFLDQPVIGKGVISKAFAGALNKGMRAGQVSASVGRKYGLAPYSSTDDINRAWSYWWQKLHTEEWLGKFEKGSIGWDEFATDGLPFFSRTTKNRFQQIYNTQGREDALRWIGKIAADESQWIYGVGAQPALMQKPFGRYVGMFGTWPLWALELYANRMWQGTASQRVALAARTLALVGAFTNMIIETGFDLWDWIAPLSVVGYSGGPVVDHSITTKSIIEADGLDQKARAAGNLITNIGRLAVPGQIFYSDVRRSLDSFNWGEAGLKMMLGRHVDEFNFGLEILYNPDVPQPFEMFQPPTPPGLPPISLPSGGLSTLDRDASLEARGSPPSGGSAIPEVYVPTPWTKSGVNWTAMNKDIVDAMGKIDAVTTEIAGRRAIVTSGREGIHSPGSYHYEGKAIDLRTRDMTPDQIQDYRDRLARRLGPKFDVVIEPDHIHVERETRRDSR